MTAKHLTLDKRNAYFGLEDVVCCKWSEAIVMALQRGASRPAHLKHDIPSISTTMLNQRLRKLVAYGFATRADGSAAASHDEYRLTSTGAKLARVVEQIHGLMDERDSTQVSRAASQLSPPRSARWRVGA